MNVDSTPHESLHLERLEAEQVQPLRTKVLRPHFQEGEICEFPQDYQSETVHFGLIDEALEVYAVVTFLPNACPQKPELDAIQLRGMCVDEAMQKKGLGARLLEGSLGRLAVHFPAAEIVWCNARMSAADFYEKMGFQPAGEVFEIDDIGPHVVMWKILPRALA